MCLGTGCQLVDVNLPFFSVVTSSFVLRCGTCAAVSVLSSRFTGIYQAIEMEYMDFGGAVKQETENKAQM